MKQPFTPIGLLEKQNELYLLSDEDLLTEAQALATDIKTFMDAHFIFTISQATYLNDLSERAAFSLGCQIAAVLNIRGSITMDDLPLNPMGRPKQLSSDEDGEIIHQGGLSPVLSGNASIHLSWTLL
ncbi:MAG: hypothetical protein P0Y49_14005 [Candidatus Pedobacter colombiensis]|uniref:Uncharacterized protein n=1 Tax=Candidatus Pedobacter colombiensis TaxID=3121371 RepID=A0AAJ6B4Q5_9SPHI|nr:hypothetical protein [Pedobacter sp.]WEK17912.1 MAG: hypothetical protein P0Y49_14005 [Pedobacter sp.]